MFKAPPLTTDVADDAALEIYLSQPGLKGARWLNLTNTEYSGLNSHKYKRPPVLAATCGTHTYQLTQMSNTLPEALALALTACPQTLHPWSLVPQA